MCFLLLHHRTRPDHPLVLLANRDETFDRPFEGPRLRDAEHGIVAPRDLRGGGTWFGLNRRGLVVALTNRHGEDLEGPARSRGLLVLDLLRREDAAAALAFARDHLARTPYAGFHALLSDGRRAFVLRHRGRERSRAPGPREVLALAPGAHVVTNLHEPGEVGVPARGRPDPREPIGATIDRLERLAGDAEVVLPGGHRILKRAEDRGTVCSALAVPPLLRFASGPPDRVPFSSVAGAEPSVARDGLRRGVPPPGAPDRGPPA